MNELTPGEVRDVVFDHAPVFRRGYDETQVDEFLDRVEATMIALHDAVDEKQHELDRIALGSTEPRGGPPTGSQEHRALADQTIADARRRADQMVDNARAAAQQVVEEARAEAFRLVANASRQIVGAGTSRLPTERERQLTAAAAEIGDRIAQIRDALAAEVSYLHEILEEMDSAGR